MCIEKYVKRIGPREHRSILAKLRCGTLPLEIELGRFTRPVTPLQNRICKHCNLTAVEDECHFVIVCPYYSDLRYDLISRVTEFEPLLCYGTN